MKLYVGWQDVETRQWYTVGVLASNPTGYSFGYTKGALAAQDAKRFKPFPRMEDLHRKYESQDLFPIFSNRILPKSRPEYGDYLEWMGLKHQEIDPLAILARSGGEKSTDNLQVYPMPEKTEDGKYKSYFFVNGVRYLAPVVLDLIPTLKIGQRLFPMFDCNNPAHSLAVALRADDPTFMMGYCPRYIAEEIGTLMKDTDSLLRITVNRINRTAPYQMMVSCKAEANWPEGFETCARDECKLLTP